ncbi:MAG: penicillin-binding protein, partial [Sphingomonadaceae bacterium]|nr:penicillin-binding protein [Sphingomonadaceae bacterium]
RYAVKDRPIEQFDTDLKLPEWQLEPDDEYYYGEPGEYYYIDEQGNLVEPGAGEERGEPAFPVEGETGTVPERPRPAPRPATPAGQPGPAVGDDFLDRATGRTEPARPVPVPPRPQGSPAPPQ